MEIQYPILSNIGQSAELNIYDDPVTFLFKLRQFGEKMSELLFEEHHLDFPRENTLHNRLKILEDETILPSTWFYETYSDNDNPVRQIKFFIPENRNVRTALEELESQYQKTGDSI